MNGAEVLLRTAHAAGLEACFANPGTTEMHLVAAQTGLESRAGVQRAHLLVGGRVVMAARFVQ
jgi:thiamine pyrophosphate-dependent acetolactate synthase large subunit-like protein